VAGAVRPVRPPTLPTAERTPRYGGRDLLDATRCPYDGVILLKRPQEFVLRLLPQFTKFGIVGLAGFVVDVGGFNALRFVGGEGPLYAYPLTAKLVSAAAATVVSWVGNRYWTFRHARRSAAHREFVLFVVMCSIGTGIALACLWLSHYVLDLTSPLADNVAANGIGLALAMTFRFWAYHSHVFTEHAPVEPAAADLAAVS
jgi:putative flippase GtrA